MSAKSYFDSSIPLAAGGGRRAAGGGPSGAQKIGEPGDPLVATAVSLSTPGRAGLAAMARTFVEEFAAVFHINRCLACQTCSFACKSTWTFSEGQEDMWWNNVETRPYGGYPRVEGSDPLTEGLPMETRCMASCPGKIRLQGLVQVEEDGAWKPDPTNPLYYLIREEQLALPLYPQFGTAPNVY